MACRGDRGSGGSRPGVIVVEEGTICPTIEPPMLAYNGIDTSMNRKGCNTDKSRSLQQPWGGEAVIQCSCLC